MLETDVQASPATPAEPESRSSTWLVTGLVVVLLMVMAGAVGWWLGSDDGDTVGSVDVVDQWIDGWISGDEDAVAALYADDATLERGDSDRVLRGRTGIAFAVRSASDFTDFTEIEPETVIVGDGVVVVHATWKGVSLRGEPVNAPVVSIFEIEDDLIARQVDYFDPDELLPE